jgi:uncharacterized membrane protein YhaH (DUF805 family)
MHLAIEVVGMVWGWSAAAALWVYRHEPRTWAEMITLVLCCLLLWWIVLPMWIAIHVRRWRNQRAFERGVIRARYDR